MVAKVFQPFGNSVFLLPLPALSFRSISLHKHPVFFSLMSFPRFVNILSRLEVGPFPQSTSNKINKICFLLTLSLREKSNPAPSELVKVPLRRGVFDCHCFSFHFNSIPLMSIHVFSLAFIPFHFLVTSCFFQAFFS